MNLTTNFEQDWTDHVRRRLTSMGFEVRENATPSDVSLLFWNTLRRNLETHAPRRVVASPRVRSLEGQYPAITQIECLLAAGQDVDRYRTKGFAKPHFFDRLRNDWGIDHFHLGTSFDKRGYAARGCELLFARVTYENAWLIDVKNHESFADSDLLEILHDNWPEATSAYQLSGVSGVKLSSEEYGNLRKCNSQALVELRSGAVLAPMGGGMAASGNSLLALRQADMALAQVTGHEKYVHDNLAGIGAIHGRHVRPGSRVELQVRNGNLHAFHPETRLQLNLGKSPDAA